MVGWIHDDLESAFFLEAIQACVIPGRDELPSSPVIPYNRKQIELLDHRKLIEEPRRLERRRGRTGTDSFDHPPRLSTDIANAVAGVSWLVLNDETAPPLRALMLLSPVKTANAAGVWFPRKLC